MRKKLNIKACGVCENMRVKVPIRKRKNGNTIMSRIDYRNAEAHCAAGFILKADSKTIKVFKIGTIQKPLFNSGVDYYISWTKYARNCPYFKSMIEEEKDVKTKSGGKRKS